MLPKETQIIAIFHPDEESLVLPVLEQARAAGWRNISIIEAQTDQAAVLDIIQKCDMVLFFLSKAFARDEKLMLERFAYAATVVRKPYIPVWLESLADIRQYEKNEECDQQLLSALEMLTAKYAGTSSERLIAALEQFTVDNIPYTPSAPQVCEKPCEAYEGNEPFVFISYAHDDANRVYPIIKKLYESGWDLWYDEGIKTTERYLPVISYHVKRCSIVVLMLTNRCLNRPFVMNYELEYAKRRGIPIIPVLLEELNPQPWSKENVGQLIKIAIAPDKLLNRMGAVGLVNRGKRAAVPPAIRHNVVYDVALPPELPGFDFTVQGEDITITRYIGNDTDVVIPGTVTSPDGSMTFRITAIGTYAFTGGGIFFRSFLPKYLKKNKKALKNCNLLTSVTIPDTVRSIGRLAFVGCKSLRNIDIPDSVTSIGMMAFYGCKSLDNVIIPNSILKIDDSVFLNCHSLANISIPESVVSIGEEAFSHCYSLGNITIPESVTSIGMAAFAGCKSLTSITIPNSVIKIDSLVFLRCESLKIVIISNNNSEIGDKVFLSCKSLKTVILPDKIEKMGKNIFSGCPQLDAMFNADKTTIYQGPVNWKSSESYSIPDGVTKINGGAFSSPSLFRKIVSRSYYYRPPRSVIIPNSVIEINQEAFADYRELKSITIPNTVTAIGAFAFKNCISLRSVEIPEGVTKISHLTFFNCRSLRSVSVPENVTDIEDYAFYNCRSLKKIAIPNNVKKIGISAFMKCSSLRNIVIPESVTEIGNEAFLGCKHLKNFVIPKTVSNVGDNVFGNIKNYISARITESIAPSLYSTFMPIANEFKSTMENYIPEESNEEEADIFNIPTPPETPSAKVCCALFDVDKVSALLTELYWEGFNIFLNQSTDEKEIMESECVLAFMSKRTSESPETMDVLRKAVQHDVSRIIQVFIGDCMDLPEEIKPKLHDRQAIIRQNLSEKEFTGKIRDSLRQFGCDLGHPRGFDVTKSGDSVEIIKFNPTGFNQVAIPKTFFTPPLQVTNIGATAFMGCEFLTSVIIPEGVTSINNGDVGILNQTGAFKDCESLITVIIPNSVTNIGDCAFYGCEALSNIQIPNNVKYIGRGAFYRCKALTDITIPDNITSINDVTFGSCDSLTYLNIPKSVISIGSMAFCECGSLKRIIIPDSVTSFGKKNIFDKCNSLTIYTPNGSKAWQYAKENNIRCKSIADIDINHCDAESFNWYVKAVEQGSATAQNKLGINYAEGKGVEKNLEKANYWFAKAAEQGNANAQVNLGLNYANGKGVEKDFEKANYWFNKAAEQGNANAQNSLGISYTEGNGAPKDLEKANYWFAKAAEQGHARSQCSLGINYANGDGVPKDLNMARRWLTLAAEKGNEKAKEELSKLDT